MSYTLMSRGIGPGLSIPVVDLAYANGQVTNSVAPREAAYHRFHSNEHAEGWKRRDSRPPPAK